MRDEFLNGEIFFTLLVADSYDKRSRWTFWCPCCERDKVEY